MLRDKILKRFNVEKDCKKTIKAAINTNLEIEGETLEKILELGIRALGKNSNYENVLKEKQLTQQTIYKISDKNDLEEISKKLDNINNSREINTQTKQETQNTNFDLEEQFEKFLAHRNDFDKIGEDTIRNSKSSFRYLKYFIDKDTKFDFSFFKEVQKKFQQIPKNFFKYVKYYKKSFTEVLELKKTEDYQVLSNKTINNHMSKYATFFDFLVYEEIIKENPLNNIKPLQEEKETPKIAYLKEDLDNIFNSKIEKIYLNMCKFSLYTGLRIEEVLSIKKEDIQDNCIHVNIENKTTKKHTRSIPIHKNLLSTIEEQIKVNKGDFLFFNINIDNEVTNVGKRVNRRLKSVINNEFKTFHSFRKNFSQEIELNTDAEEQIKKYLMGHSFAKDVTYMAYNGQQMNSLKQIDCINQITFTY